MIMHSHTDHETMLNNEQKLLMFIFENPNTNFYNVWKQLKMPPSTSNRCAYGLCLTGLIQYTKQGRTHLWIVTEQGQKVAFVLKDFCKLIRETREFIKNKQIAKIEKKG